MPQKPERPLPPEGAITIITFTDLHQWIKDFSTGKYRFILLIGPPGVSKSMSIKAAITAQKYLYLENRASPFEIYRQLYVHLHEPVIIDDLDELYNDKQAVRLLKSLCNTDPTKTMQWTTAHRSIGLGDDQTPARFETRSPVMLICNEWRTKSENIRAIEDRAQVLHFCPSPSEIHWQVSAWFGDTEVFSFISDQLHLITRPSMRAYLKGKEQRLAGNVKWKDHLLTIMGITPETCQLVAIEFDPTLKTVKARAERFTELGLGDRATYFRRKKLLPPPVDRLLVKRADARQLETANAEAVVARSHIPADSSVATKIGDHATVRLAE